MVSNLIFYGIAIGLGFAFSFYFSEKEERNIWLLIATFTIPAAWTYALSRHVSFEIDGLSALLDLYNIEYLLTKHSGRNAAALGIVPFLWTFCFFGSIWIELSRLKNKKAYQGRAHNSGGSAPSA